jgi:hypothetical protein
MNAIETRKQETADRLGIDVSRVHSQRIELGRLRESGLLIDLDIHGISMFSVQTSFAELGIGADDVRTERMHAGRKDLFPKLSKKLRSLEARARQNLEKYSHVVPAFGQYRWLPWTAYGEFITAHNEIVADLEIAKAEAISRWDEIYEENRRFFSSAAEQAWKALLGQHAPGDEVMIVTNDGPVFNSRYDHNYFVKYLTQKALGKMPVREEIASLVRIDYTTSILYDDTELLAQDAQREALNVDIARSKVEQAEAEHQVWEMKAAENRYDATIGAFRKAEMEHARAQLAAMGSPIQDALDGLRTNLYDAVQSLLEGLRKNSGFKGRASTRAAELYSYWKTLNGGLLQDAELDQALAGLDAEMRSYQSAGKDGREGQLGTITGALVEISTLTAESARKMRSENARAAALEF